MNIELTNTIEAFSANIETVPDLSGIPFAETIIAAITNRQNIAMRYRKDRLPRAFSPYLFRLAKNGNFVVIGMQVQNPNSLDDDNERRTFIVTEIKSLELTNETFEPIEFSPGNEPSHSSGIIACVVPLG